MRKTDLGLLAILTLVSCFTVSVQAQSPPRCEDTTLSSNAIQYCSEIGLRQTPWGPLPMILRPFPDSLGNLLSISICYYSRTSGTVQYENTNNQPVELEVKLGADVNILLPQGLGEADISQADSFMLSLPAFDGNLDFDGKSGGKIDSLEVEKRESMAYSVDQLTPEQFTLFTGNSPIVLVATATSASSTNGSGNETVSFETLVEVEACITYLYEPPPLIVDCQTTPVTCNGESDGSLTLFVDGGAGDPYEVSISGPGLGNSIPDFPGGEILFENLPAGEYNYIVSDKNGNQKTGSCIVESPDPLEVNITPPSGFCTDSENNVSVVINGGTAPYSYLWNTGDTTATLIGSGPGNYSVIVTDANGCQARDSAELDIAPSPILDLVVLNPVTCNGEPGGALQAIVNSGTPPYNIEWNTEAQSGIISNLPSGSYSAVVTDLNGCQAEAGIRLEEPSPIEVNISLLQGLVCQDDSTGILQGTASGGTGPYTFSWNNGMGSGTTLEDLTAGLYILLVTDANDCTSGASFDLNSPNPIQSNINIVQDIACFGENGASLSVLPTGGNGPYDISWNTGSNSQVINNLGPGSYSVEITDTDACIARDSIIITEPDSIILSIDLIQENICDGDSIATLTAVASGGTGLYQYEWNNGFNSPTISGLGPGSYSISLTDENGCTKDAGIVLPELAAFSVELQIAQAISCANESDGTLSPVINGGTAPYQYLWNTGDTTRQISDLPPGLYELSVTDSNLCTRTAAIELVSPEALFLQIDIEQGLECAGDTDGILKAQGIGGTEPYNYTWNTGSAGSTLNNIGAGSYEVMLSDANGCTSKLPINLSEPDSIRIDLDVQGELFCKGDSGANITANLSGGTLPYQISWNTGDSTNSISNLGAGSYEISVSDANQCQTSESTILEEPEVLDIFIVQSGFILCAAEQTGALNLQISGGTSPYKVEWNTGDTGQTIDSLGAGIYTAFVSDSLGCTQEANFEIEEPEDLALSINIEQAISCNGAADGILQANISGGTAPYTFNWNNVIAGNRLSNLGPGTYELIVLDANDCQVKASILLQEPEPLNLSLQVAQEATCSDDQGAINSIITGGTPPYNYNWNTGDSTSALEGLGAGLYSLSILDQNSCSIAGEIELEARSIDGITLIAVGPCEVNNSTYDVELEISYQGLDSQDSLLIMGQSFAVTGSPQRVTLVDLSTDGEAVDLLVSSKQDEACSASLINAFVAPEPCLCKLRFVYVGYQSKCDPVTDTYKQVLGITYRNEPDSGTLVIETSTGQRFEFPIGYTDGESQVVNLEGLPADGELVSLIVYFSEATDCKLELEGHWQAPEPCFEEPVCRIRNVNIGYQGDCDRNSNTYSQILGIRYENEPNEGLIEVEVKGINTYQFPIGYTDGVSQVIKLEDLPADGKKVDLSIRFSDDEACEKHISDAWRAPNACVSTHSARSWEAKIHPNPSQGRLFLEFEGAPEGKYELIIYNINGKPVYEGSINLDDKSTSQEISTSAFPEGAYQLFITGPNGKRMLRFMK